jgi:threonine synthase
MSIWKYQQLNNIEPKYQLTLNEGATRLVTKNINNRDVSFKFENENPNGSFKDRSLAYQLSSKIAEGHANFVVSSSGNAAISAAAYAKLAGVTLHIFVSEHINMGKLNALQGMTTEKIILMKSLRPKSDAIQYSRETGAYNLRGSADETAVTGFKTIAYELAEQAPKIDAVFVPCSSGTSSAGIMLGFAEMKLNPGLHICQTARINPMASSYDKDFAPAATSLADAIVDKVARRKQQINDFIQQSNGSGWVLSDAELDQSLAELEKLGFTGMSYNSALAFAGFIKAMKAGLPCVNPVIILSGT